MFFVIAVLSDICRYLLVYMVLSYCCHAAVTAVAEWLYYFLPVSYARMQDISPPFALQLPPYHASVSLTALHR